MPAEVHAVQGLTRSQLRDLADAGALEITHPGGRGFERRRPAETLNRFTRADQSTKGPSLHE